MIKTKQKKPSLAQKKEVWLASKSKVFREVFEWAEVLAVAALLALFIDTCIIANSVVPSASMENTIMTGDRVIGLRLSYLFSDPRRGDIIIFKYPDDESVYFNKRVIGLPGETVDIVDDRVYINGELLEESYLKEPMDRSRIDGDLHFEVPEGCYFVMGDNRNESKDARYWSNTYVARNKIIAKVLFEYYPKFKIL